MRLKVRKTVSERSQKRLKKKKRKKKYPPLNEQKAEYSGLIKYNHKLGMPSITKISSVK